MKTYSTSIKALNRYLLYIKLKLLQM